MTKSATVLSCGPHGRTFAFLSRSGSPFKYLCMCVCVSGVHDTEYSFTFLISPELPFFFSLSKKDLLVQNGQVNSPPGQAVPASQLVDYIATPVTSAATSNALSVCALVIFALVMSMLHA